MSVSSYSQIQILGPGAASSYFGSSVAFASSNLLAAGAPGYGEKHILMMMMMMMMTEKIINKIIITFYLDIRYLNP